MSPEQVKLREIFSEALTKASAEERERYLGAACGDDADLRRQIDVLIEAHGQSGDFLCQNVMGLWPLQHPTFVGWTVLDRQFKLVMTSEMCNQPI
jgi:hypothetical protein